MHSDEKKIINAIHRRVGSTWGEIFLHGHAELVESRNLMAGNFDSHLGIKKIWLFEASPYVSMYMSICW